MHYMTANFVFEEVPGEFAWLNACLLGMRWTNGDISLTLTTISIMLSDSSERAWKWHFGQWYLQLTHANSDPITHSCVIPQNRKPSCGCYGYCPSHPTGQWSDIKRTQQHVCVFRNLLFVMWFYVSLSQGHSTGETHECWKSCANPKGLKTGLWNKTNLKLAEQFWSSSEIKVSNDALATIASPSDVKMSN